MILLYSLPRLGDCLKFTSRIRIVGIPVRMVTKSGLPVRLLRFLAASAQLDGQAVARVLQPHGRSSGVLPLGLLFAVHTKTHPHTLTRYELGYELRYDYLAHNAIMSSVMSPVMSPVMSVMKLL